MRLFGGKAIANPGFNLRALLLLGFGHLVTDLSQGGLPIILPLLREVLGLTYAASGMIIMTSNLTSSIVQPLFGYLSDRWGSTWMMPLGAFVACAGFAALGFISSYTMLLGTVFLSGLGVASYHPEGFKTARFFTGHRRATGLSIFSVGGNLGIALGPVLAVMGYSWFGLKGTAVFLVPGIVASVLILISLRWLSDPRRISGHELNVSPPTVRPIGRRWVPLSLLVLGVTVRSLIHMGIVAFVPFYFVDVLKQGPAVAGKMVTVFLLAGAAGTLIGAPIADRVGYKRFFVASMAVLSPILWVFLGSQGLEAVLTLALAGGIVVSSFSVTIVMAQKILPDRLGVASGLMVGFAIGMGGIGATIMGTVADTWGVVMVLQLTACLPILGTLIALLIPMEEKEG